MPSSLQMTLVSLILLLIIFFSHLHRSHWTDNASFPCSSDNFFTFCYRSAFRPSIILKIYIISRSHLSNSIHFSFIDRNLDIFRPTAACEPRTFLRGIDVNRLPATTGDEEDLGVSSPNNTVSSISGNRSEREATHGGSSEENEMERACSHGMSDEEDGENSRKKLRLSKDLSTILEETFKEQNTLNPKQKLALAKRFGLHPRQVEVWFQNRGARI